MSRSFEDWPEDGIVQTEAPPRFDHYDILRALSREYDFPSEGLREALEVLPDSALPSFTRLIRDIDSEAVDSSSFDFCVPRVDLPDLQHAQHIDTQTVRLPITDRPTLSRYLSIDAIGDAINTYCESQGWMDEDSPDDEERLRYRSPLPEAPEDSPEISTGKIEDLPKPVEPMNHETLLGLVGAYFWSEQPGRKPYKTLFDTLEDIADDIPDELVLPMALLIEKDYREIVDDDDCYNPIVHYSRSSSPSYVENGIVWQDFLLKDSRHDLVVHLGARSDRWLHDLDEEELIQNFEEHLCAMLVAKAINSDAGRNRILQEVETTMNEIFDRENKFEPQY